MKYTRRQMTRFLAGVTAFLMGRPAGAQYNQVPGKRTGVVLVLDGTDYGVEVVYRGQRVTVTPQEIIDALKG